MAIKAPEPAAHSLKGSVSNFGAGINSGSPFVKFPLFGKDSCRTGKMLAEHIPYIFYLSDIT